MQSNPKNKNSLNPPGGASGLRPAGAPVLQPALQWWLWILIPVAGFVWFWIFRSNQWSGGDSEYWEREIANGIWLRKRQMLSFAVMQGAHQLTGLLWGWWSARRAINAISCVAGALVLLIAWRLLRDGKHPGWALAVFATGGYMTLFYGHLETYSQAIAALLFHLLAVQRTLERRWRPWTIVATFGLALWFHLIALFTLPALAVVLFCEMRARGGGTRREWGAIGLAALPTVALWSALTWFHWGAGELVGEARFIAPPLELIRRPWIVFTQNWVAMKGRFLFWNGGAAVVAGVWIMARGLARRKTWRGEEADRFLIYLAGYFLCFLIHFAIWVPDAADFDWDLFAFPWVLTGLIAARHVMDLRWRSVWVGLILGVNCFLFLTRTVMFADLGERATGTIVLERSPEVEQCIVVLDDRIFLRAVNRYIPGGTHIVKVFVPPRTKDQIVLVVQGGECYRLSISNEGIRWINPNESTAQRRGE